MRNSKKLSMSSQDVPVFTGMDDIDKHTLTNQSGRWMCAVRHLFLLVFHIQLFYDSVQCIRFYSYLP